MKKLVYCIQGPTASGKTSLAIALAKMLGTEIISADSRQFYREMNIGTAKPSPEDLEQVPHHFIGNRSVIEPMNVAEFKQEAFPKLEALLSRFGSAVVVGGSSQFIDGLVEGLDEVPVFPEIRSQLEQQLEEEGLRSLLNELNYLDPGILQQIDQNNPRRVLRALEVIKGSGRSWVSFQQLKAPAHFDVQRFVIHWPREVLYERINQRVDQMVNDGLEQEVHGLLNHKDLSVLNTVGYKEWFDFFEGNASKVQ
ncbi:MAG: tRNA (adenosine(37)-N6)-dimethylallyltransferase MiaA, partial [Bacteroidota bacterium]